MGGSYRFEKSETTTKGRGDWRQRLAAGTSHPRRSFGEAPDLPLRQSFLYSEDSKETHNSARGVECALLDDAPSVDYTNMSSLAPQETQLPRYPLLFTYRDPVFGNGFIASVTAANGRVLAVQEDQEWWVYGVNPGGLAGHGKDLAEAHADFRRGFTEVLHDIADGASSFAEFEREVGSFFNETNDVMESGWLDAVAMVRAHQLTVDDLPKVPAESRRELYVAMVVRPTSQNNALDDEMPMKLAA